MVWLAGLMHVAIAGASGFLGSHLATHLAANGHRVSTLVRRSPSSPLESQWDPYAGIIDRELIASCDAVVNLAGVSIAGNPHSRRWAEQVRSSRVRTTALLAETIARSPRPPTLIAGNGISYYGDHGAEPLTERSESRGNAFLTGVTQEWQAAADPALAAGARVCILRTAPVLDRTTAPLKPMLSAFKCGMGARLGGGQQHFPIISRRDWVGAASYLLDSRDVAGVFNLCCPRTPTNAEFTDALARLVGRRARLSVPSGVLRLATGPMSPELLGSVNARPDALIRAGYDFWDRDVDEVLAAAVG